MSGTREGFTSPPRQIEHWVLNTSNAILCFQNSIRHNLSLHSRFVRVQAEGSGKSSWWTVDQSATLNKRKTDRLLYSTYRNFPIDNRYMFPLSNQPPSTLDYGPYSRPRSAVRFVRDLRRPLWFDTQSPSLDRCHYQNSFARFSFEQFQNNELSRLDQQIACSPQSSNQYAGHVTTVDTPIESCDSCCGRIPDTGYPGFWGPEIISQSYNEVQPISKPPFVDSNYNDCSFWNQNGGRPLDINRKASFS